LWYYNITFEHNMSTEMEFNLSNGTKKTKMNKSNTDCEHLFVFTVYFYFFVWFVFFLLDYFESFLPDIENKQCKNKLNPVTPSKQSGQNKNKYLNPSVNHGQTDNQCTHVHKNDYIGKTICVTPPNKKRPNSSYIRPSSSIARKIIHVSILFDIYSIYIWNLLFLYFTFDFNISIV
jgi:hypothetical protein